MKYLSVIFVALLVACGAAPTKPDQEPTKPIFVGTEVQVPVPVKCHVVMPDEPLWQVDVVPAASTSEFEKSKAVLAELEQRRAYELLVKAAAITCE